MTTPELLDYHSKQNDIADRIERSYHYVLQLTLSKQKQMEVLGANFPRINLVYDKKIRIEKLHIQRLEKRYNDLIIRYVSERL